jgi:hypothetical protein
MRAEFVDDPHPLLIGRIVWVIGNVFDRVNPAMGRLDVLAMFLLGHHPRFSVRPQTRRRNGADLSIHSSSFHGRDGFFSGRKVSRGWAIRGHNVVR